MNTRDVVRRLEAFSEGRPMERGRTMHLRIADEENLVALAFVRMGGESLPWAVGTCHPGGTPEVLAVPDARDRDRVGAMLVELTSGLASLLDHPQWGGGGVTADMDAKDVSLRQIWTPNGSHVQMLHMLNLRYTFARAGDPDRAATLRALGRLSGFLFREASLPGEATIVDATAALREAFTFPADDLRQQHLGFLLALLETKGNAAKRATAAEAAERFSISTSLDPELERDRLEPFVDRHTDARRRNSARGTKRAEGEIAAILREEVERRLGLTLHAVGLLRGDHRPLNAGAAKLATESTKRRQREFLWLEEQLVRNGEDNGYFPASPETDQNRATGAARYHRVSGAAEDVEAALVHDDEELQEDAVAAGNALRGTIVKVEDRSPGDFRGTVPVWTVEASSASATRLRRGSAVCVGGMPSRKGTVLSTVQSNGKRTLEVEIDGWKKKPDPVKHPRFAAVPAAADPSLEGTELLLLPSGMGGFGARKSSRVREAQGPGAWITHGEGSAPLRARRRNRDDLLGEVEALRNA